MWRSKKFIIVAVLAAIVLAAGSIGGVALAQTGSTGDGSGNTLLARVAKILGIDQQKLEQAFTQAQTEMRNEALDTYLKDLVTQGKITQQQADQYKQWWQSRPNVPGLGLKGPMGFPGGPLRLPGTGRAAANACYSSKDRLTRLRFACSF